MSGGRGCSRQLLPLAVPEEAYPLYCTGYGLTAAPFLSSLQSDGTHLGSGCIRVEPNGLPLPAYCVRYNLVRTQLP